MIHRSPYPDLEIPEAPLTEVVLRLAEARSDQPALIDGAGGRSLSFGELQQAVRRVARSLADRGFKKGEVFAIYCPNLPEYAVIFHGVALAGGVNTTINPLYTVEELERQLNDSQTRFLLTVPPFLEKAKAAAAKTESLEEIFVLGEAPGATPFAKLMQSEGEPPRIEIDPRKDLVVLPYSSGTTGLNKGVMLTHHNLVANMIQTVTAFDDVHEGDVLLGLLPFFHIYGMVVIMNMGLYQGASVVTMPRFDLEGLLSLIQKYRVTGAHLVPPIILALSKHPLVDQYDLSSLRFIFSGAAPLGEPLAKACKERIGCGLYQGYGLTETSPVTHANPAAEGKVKLGSVGPALPNTECQIVDLQSGESLGIGKEGEVWIRGPQVMQGYLKQAEATKLTIDVDGWLHTGDVGYIDEDGYLFIVDRLKELIKYKGMQVAPAELESLLLSHPAVADAAVIPLRDEEAGEVPKAFVVLKGEASEEELMDYVAEHVAPHKRIRSLELIEQIPKSPSGKILRRVLVAQEREKEQAE